LEQAVDPNDHRRQGDDEMEDNVKSAKIGKIGFWLALVPWFTYVLTFVCAIAGVRGFG